MAGTTLSSVSAVDLLGRSVRLGSLTYGDVSSQAALLMALPSGLSQSVAEIGAI